jgi:alpha-N-arabinofuranosidase
LDLRGAPASGGIFAPTIRWNDGRFFVTGTNVSRPGHFIVNATDPSGPWSDPVWVDQNGIDPSLYFDDGTVYFTSTVEPDPSLLHLADPGFRRGIQQCTIDPFTGAQLSESRFLWEGSGGKMPEAPHLFKRGDYYYLLLAEGGTEYGHMVTVARSTEPWGPWESAPSNPILSHRSTGSPIQATGHADFVELHDGSWWMVCLGVRPVGGWPRHHLGRETFLAPLVWSDDGWPALGGTGRVEMRAERPALPRSPGRSAPVRDDFERPTLGPQWNTLRTPLSSATYLSESPGSLVLHGEAATLDEPGVVFVGRRQQHFACTAAACLIFEPGASDEAGLTVRMNEDHHYEIGVDRSVAGERMVFVRRRIGSLSKEIVRRPSGPGALTLEIIADADHYRFAFANGAGDAAELASGETRYLATEVAGGFTGVYFGMYATGNGRASTRPAQWDWFEYRPESLS